MGSLGLIVRRSLRQHALATSITVLSTALASGLVLAVFSVSQQTRQAFTGGQLGFDAVLGARGSELQLVLNAVFHLETSPGNLPWSVYEDVKADPQVALAIPYAVGDSYRGFRVVGTTTELFTDLELREGEGLRVRAGGQVFDPGFRQAVIGAEVARETGLGVNSELRPTHGVARAGGEEHEEEYVVCGVLEPTGTPADRVIWIPIEGVFRMTGHVLRGAGEDFEAEHGEEIPGRHREVSAVLLELRTPQAGFRLQQSLDRSGQLATLAWPIGRVMGELFDKLGWMSRVLELVAYLVVAVAAGSILASLYNTMNERRREFAILRALGARRRTVFAAIVLEATAIATLGAALGLGVCGAILAVTARIVRAETGVVLDVLAWHPAFVAVPAGMLALGALAGLVPAFKAYSTDVADTLGSGG